MTNTISKQSIIPDVWKNFYNRIKSQVTTVEITGAQTITVQNYVSSFPDQLIDSKSDYPIIVVDDPKIQTGTFTSGKTKADCNITITVYTIQSESASKFLSSVIYAIDTYKGDLSGVGIKEVEVNSTSQDSAQRGKIKLHKRSITFDFVLFYSKGGGF